MSRLQVSVLSLSLALTCFPSGANAAVTIIGDERRFETVQEAIEAAPADAVLLIGCGVYPERLYWRSKSLTLRGVCESNTNAAGADGSDPRPVIRPSGGNAIHASADSISDPAQEIVVENLGFDISAADTAVAAEVASVTIRNCWISGSGRGLGLTIYYPKGTVTFEQNWVSDVTTAVLVGFSPNLPPSERRFTANGNVFYGVTNGIQVEYAVDVAIKANTLWNNDHFLSAETADYATKEAMIRRLSGNRQGAGIALIGVERGEVSDNMLCQIHVGFALYGSNHLRISGNSTGGDLDAMDWFPISFFETADPELSMRRLAMAKGTGGGLTNSGSNNNIDGNMFCGGGYGVEENHSENTVYEGNIVQRHEQGATATPGTGRVNFGGIWFGSEEGPGPGPGDVSHRISYATRRPVRTSVSDHTDRVERPIPYLTVRPPLPDIGACPIPTFPPRPSG